MSLSTVVFLKDGTAVTVTSAAEFPDASEISYSLEPRAKLTVIFPSKFIGDVMKLLQNSRGVSSFLFFSSSKPLKGATFHVSPS